jgi:hypothetical protein
MKLHDLIELLEQQSKLHGGNVDCEIWIYDRTLEGVSGMSAASTPTFEFHSNTDGDWLSIDFEDGIRQDA